MELTRRTFSALAGTTVLGLVLGGGSSGAVPDGAGLTVPTGPPPPRPRADGVRHRVGRDRYSLLVDGRRLVLWPGELHPFRLPSPSLWRDALEKMRAHGYNAVEVPVAWNVHSPAPDRYDFTGVRDLDLFLRTAAGTGLYVVVRPGPYIGADVDGGGLPGWLAGTGARPRTTDAAYLRHADAWLARVDATVRRHLYTRGKGTVLLYRLEEAGDSADARALARHVRGKVRADGIDVPLVAGGTEVRRTSGPEEERRLRLAGLGAGGTAVPAGSLAFGGINPGWLGAPALPTRYDEGAAFDGGRKPTSRLAPVHQLGQLTRHVPDFARLKEAARVRAGDRRVSVRHLANPDTGTQVYVLRNDSDDEVTTTLPGTAVEAPVKVAARDAKLLATGLSMGGERKLAYSTAQPMMFLSDVGGQDIAVFAGRHGEMAQVVLECPSEPETMRLDAEAAWAHDHGRLNVNVPLGIGGLARVSVAGGGSDRTLILLFADDATSLRMWPYETGSGTFLVYGPALLRGVTLKGSTAHLTGDTTGATGLEVWGPPGMASVTWNGTARRANVTRAGSLTIEGMLPGAPPVQPPALDGWRRRRGNPESDPGFDDADWTRADRTESYSTTPVPAGGPVLFADDYGCHYGDVWYRARLTDPAGLTSVSLAHRTGPDGLVLAWLDGEPLGGGGGADGETETVLRLSGRLRERFADRDGEAVLAVLVRPGPHDGHKTARGLTEVSFRGAAPRAAWRIRGAGTPDPVRGPLNNGGLHGEREGWHLPGADGDGWEPVESTRTGRRQGETWYRTGFRPEVPAGVDASFGLVLEDGGACRAQIFLNGWNIGQYAPGQDGAQHTFVLPGGILRPRSANTLALAVLTDGTTDAGPGTVRLTVLGGAAGGVPLQAVSSPGR
ncbi:beta-galactosidase [Streptomyces sp. ISL-12]|uniref:beta-galactosidase n=1 Tax=Streptomyces sp. ISL-12 TaxID=2819177 RepID=UPI001BEC10A8|nr:beta-galactosidase [Streptomyces sp. ISL-12]MBT2413314.1 beta-galactosidase [Streptomyces sp. ISL-12]